MTPQTRKLSGRHCQCTACGQYFNSDGAFDKHRVGSFGGVGGKSNRACLTADQMHEAGMSKNSSDWWITQPYDAVSTFAARPSSPSEPERLEERAQSRGALYDSTGNAA